MASKLVPCKACNQEIAKGVKKCPNCGKDQRNWFMRHKFLSFIGIIIIIAVISSLGGGGGDDKAAPASGKASETKSDEKIYKVNDTVTVDDKAEVVVTKVEEKDNVGNEYVNKDVSDGGVFVAVQLTVKNVSDKPLSMFSTPSFKLVDEKGTEYDADIDASSNYSIETDIDNSKIASDLNPGIKVTDVQVYEISKDAYAKGKWYLSISGDEKVEIK
ncbi:DUF4352 domain-containing protein [Niallia taxi]|uniref:DUF4352 domain-containing protein n=1 Tax=Niallia taxi TaxID=2499688 RepID=A0A3S2TTR9_9BACI|nr:DUF4352 domain-containing protein [Niallia taxi]RVT61607.1 DUF4352 domain-containing protein [Niallia taxi]